MMNFPFGTNGKFIILGVPILKHIRVCQAREPIETCCDDTKYQDRTVLSNSADPDQTASLDKTVSLSLGGSDQLCPGGLFHCYMLDESICNLGMLL